MDIQLPLFDTFIRLLLATALGAILGWEREVSRKPAGLRTHMMVSLGAAAFTLITLDIFQSVVAAMEQTRADPIRIVEGIIGGIGFLGAGTIIRSRGSVEGITTAASIWVVGAVGVACGAGSYAIALLIVGFSFLIVVPVGRLSVRYFRQQDEQD